MANAVITDGIHNITFYIKDVTSGVIYDSQTVVIKRDATLPTANIVHRDLSGWEKFLSIITLGMWSPDKMNFNISCIDVASGIKKIEYLIKEGTTEVMDEEALDSVSASEWKEYNGSIAVESNKIFVIYTKVTDNAGQYVYACTNGIVFDRTAVPKDNINISILNQDNYGFYDGDVKVNVRISDALPSSGIKSVEYAVFNNGNKTQGDVIFNFDIDNPTYEQLMSTWDSADDEKDIVVDSQKNNSDNVVVRIKVTDNAGNVTEKEVPLKICINKPTIEVTYTDESEAVETYDNVTYYAAKRVAKIVITGRTSIFNKSVTPKVMVSESKGDSKDRITYEVAGWSTNELAGNPDAATHTYIINFNGSANYEFTVDYTDVFGNNLNYSSDKFAVDLDKPTASITIDEDNTWTKLLETLTFGLWNNREVFVKATYDDATSPIKSVEYYKSNSDTILTTTELTNVEWSEYAAFKIVKDEQFVVYIKVTDYAGHISYICSDGYIVDMKESNIVITPDSPNENGYYNDDFYVRLDIEDVAPYSGIKSVEYWVICNGAETIRRTIYSYKNEYAPVQSDLKSSLTDSIKIDAKSNNSDSVSLYVKVVDNAGNENVKCLDNIKIDAVAPQINVGYDVNNANIVDDRGYIKSNRMATITFVERTSTFDRERATEGIVVRAVDGDGNVISLDRSAMIKWGETEEVAGKPDLAKHTAYVYFTTDANYEFTVSYIDKAGNGCKYEDVVFADGTVAPCYFTIDKVNPSATVSVADKTWNKLVEVLTFGIFKSEKVTVTASASDETSPVTIEYYKTNNTNLYDKDTLDAINASEWNEYSEISSVSDDRFVVYLKVTDYAGNYIYISTDGHIVDMTESDITLTPEATDMYHGMIPLYNKDVNVLINVKEKKNETYSGINKVEYWVKCDGEETQRDVLYSFNNESPEYSELLQTYSKTVTIKSSINDSCDVVMYVGVTDNAGNYSEENIAVDIDVVSPKIKVTYDNNNAYKVIDGKGYFPDGRKAIVTITERTEHFDVVKATERISITATDVNGKKIIEDISSLIGEWSTIGTGNEAVHSVIVDYSMDANYTFDISYTDCAGNSNDGIETDNSVAVKSFAVDKTAPTGSVTVGKLGTWDKLINVLTFGLWSKETVNITATANDSITVIESVSYVKTSDTVAKTTEELSEINSWTEYSGITVSQDEQFVVYLKIVDKKIKKENKNSSFIAILVFNVVWTAIIYPLCDVSHMICILIPMMPLMLFCIDIKPIRDWESYVCVFITVFISACAIIPFMAIGDNYMISDIPYYRGVYIDAEVNQTIEEIADYINDKYGEGYNVRIANAFACAYMIPLDRYEKNWSMLLVGNIGDSTTEKLLDDDRNYIYLVLRDSSGLNAQDYFELIDYIKENYVKVGEVQKFDVYEAPY